VILASLFLIAFVLSTGIVPQIFSYSIAPKIFILFARSQCCEFYRQRFFIDPKHEWGFHWRVGVLWFAKWPYILLALCDVKLKRKFPYALTRKTKYISANTMLLLPNILVMTLICSAWVVGMINGRITNPFLHICALVSIGGCLALILSDRWHF